MKIKDLIYAPMIVAVMIAGLVLLGGCRDKHPADNGAVGADWPVYGGNKAGNRYSALDQINASNVQRLAVAWTFDTGENNDSTGSGHEMQCQPIVVGGVLYGTTPELNLFAIDAANGKLLWKFSAPYIRQRFNTNRGVVYWAQGTDKRILYSTGSSLYAINAVTGKPVADFGKAGIVDLHEGLAEGLGHDVQGLMVTATTPGVLYRNTLIIGSSVSEGGDAAPGHVRAFDVVTGQLKWVFHTIPLPGEPGYATWPKDAYRKIGGANCWGGLAVDERRGVVYFGTGSPSSDFYGGARAGQNLYANCIVAVDAGTGRLRWFFQTVHHDLWDRDIPCPPNLTTIKHDGKPVDVVVQTTKDGLVYVLDRDSGRSLFPVEERPVPTDGLPGEHPWAMQRYPLKPAPLSRQMLTDSDLTDLTPEAHAFVEKRFRQLRRPYNKFLPPDEAGTLLLGYSGGAEWGGNAVDSDGIFYQNANEAFWDLQMITLAEWKKELASLSQGQALYVTNCSACHGADRKGSPGQYPDLRQVRNRQSAEAIAALIQSGNGKMPAFPQLSAGDRKAIAGFLLRPWAVPPPGEHSEIARAGASTGVRGQAAGAPVGGAHGAGRNGRKDTLPEFPYEPDYTIKMWKQFTDSNGYPGTKPPWGTLNAIDLNTGEYVWRVPLGEYPELAKKGVPVTGSESYGGPLVTAGGLVFIAGTRDGRFRAFDRKTGRLVWSYQLPAAGFATPITYTVQGRQYIALAAGGGKGSPYGGKYVAFALK